MAPLAVLDSAEQTGTALISEAEMRILDNARAHFFICDQNFNIVFANKKSCETLAEMEPSLNKFDAWRFFRASSVVGMNLDFFFADCPEEFRRASDPRQHPYFQRITLGSCLCDVQVTGLFGEDGARVGYQVEWEHVTARVEEEVRLIRLSQVLENSKSSVMITDTDLKISYINSTLQRNLKTWEAEFQKVFGPGFNAGALLGRCIDDFHKNPQHQRRILANESAFPFETRISVGPYKFDLVVNSVRGPKGEILGYSTEWFDVTDRLREEAEYKEQVKTIADRMEFLRNACSTDLAKAMEALANGDLTMEITPRTPLLDIPSQPDLAIMAETFNNLRNQTVQTVEAYNKARESLSGLIAKTRMATDNIATASSQLAAGTDDLSQRTEEQASSLEETASSMEQMTSTVKQNADNARQANQLSIQAREDAEKGGDVVSQAIKAMDGINQASKRITEMISTIDEIAFQTNLLALNAAVEAARVGEQGRGFAVVAAEVRNLAGRSAAMAKEIKGLVQESTQRVGEGSSLVNQTGQALEDIVRSVTRVADIIAEISAASQEQAAGIEQVNKAVMQMDQITQQNAALVEEAAAASQSVRSQAEDVREIVSRFQLSQTYLAELERQASEAKRAQMETTRTRATTPSRASRTQAPTRRPTAAPSRYEDDFEEF
jgi:methyl-accepting chemotaxis protein